MTETAALNTPQQCSAWNLSLDSATCEKCGWSYLLPAGQTLPACPHCFHPRLNSKPVGTESTFQPPLPELVAPFCVSEQALGETIRKFAARIPFAPEELQQETLRQRMTAIYLPMWLVDARINAFWQAEAGFDYRVISHQEQYSQMTRAWQSHEIEETRTRWELRVGRLLRPYQNVIVPALDDAAALEKQIGKFDLTTPQPYTPDFLSTAQTQAPACVRLPDHTPEEAWSEAVAAFQKAAADECQQACASDRLRQFRWKAQLSRPNWTMLLLPAYTSYYLDDAGHPQPVLIHGQSGQIFGERRASIKRARMLTVQLLLAGILMFLSGIMLDRIFPGTALAGAVSLLLTLLGTLCVLATPVPIVVAWDFNRRNKTTE